MHIKSCLSKLNFALGHKPKLLRYEKHNIDKFIPMPYRAVLVISCDFELAWAWRFAKHINCDLEETRKMAKLERYNILKILKLCENFDIPITWAIIGHLFLKRCFKRDGIAHEDMPRPKHFENQYWRFRENDWYSGDPCCAWRDALEWYAPDLIEKIVASDVKHEIACHTFSHIDCRSEVCSEELIKRELEKCRELASAAGIKLKSFVFPGNFIGNLKILKEKGFTSYRIDKDVLGFPWRDKYGLWQIPTTAGIGLSSYGWSSDYHIKRYKVIMERAVKFNRLCHFWFHPSQDGLFLEKVFSDLFQCIVDLKKKDKITVLTMRDYVTFLRGNRK